MFDRLEDLYGIADVVKPWLLGKYTEFCEHYIIREWTKLWKPRGRQTGYWKTIGYKNLDHLMARLKPFYLKRPASEINRYLPEVRVKTLSVTLEATQRIFYTATINAHFPPRDASDGKDYRLASLTYAQQAADMPAVLGQDIDSAKLGELTRFLMEDCTGEKVIVYTKYERVLSEIARELRRLNIPHARISGPESAGQRV